MTDKYCDDCVYKSTIYSGLNCCNYYLVTDQRRPCPAGEGCTVKVGREVNRKNKNETDNE